MDSSARSLIASYLIAIEGIQIFNEIGSAIAFGREDFALAARLETWYMSYKELWRENSLEGDLHHTSEIVFWYADCLRNRKVSNIKLYPVT